MITVSIRNVMLVLGSLLTMTMVGCGKDSGSGGSSDGFYEVSLEMDADSASLSLASVDSYDGEIDGCISGYSKSFDHNSSDLKVPSGDKNCLVKISSLDFDGDSFDLSGKSFVQGSKFVVTGDSSGIDFEFSVDEQLDVGPIGSAQSFAMSISGLTGASHSSTVNSYDTGINISVSEPIHFDISDDGIDVDSDTGGGLFDFTLSCTGSAAGDECDGFDVSDLKVGLVLDSYDGSPSLAECRSIASSDPASAAGASVVIEDLVGPTPLFGDGNDKLILAIASEGGAGCKYWAVTVQPL